ncbi:hypothetical protein A9R00_02760 [Oleispira antarctica]|uniref:Uncharacterized protein n=1 Tax=Oleispira antarctica TaxID=188908 RepID=A0A1Y5I1V1_OLEAN|nr:hypothetical protein A9R00_02760 [Oleispira antarctica]
MKELVCILVLAVFMVGCSDTESAESITSDYEYLFPLEVNKTSNKEAVIPPQCYTKHEGKHNPCMVCHQSYTFDSRPNAMSDGSLQTAYDFSDYGFKNHWQNLFEDRTDRIEKISDSKVNKYITEDNYTPLIEDLKASAWDGIIPEIENLQKGALAFDEYGFAIDGSQWVAFNYKPMPSTFWPTNGSTDDVMIRLPIDFRTSSCINMSDNKDVYIANLGLLELAIQGRDAVTIPRVDERNICDDINGDGEITNNVSRMIKRKNYFGNASDVVVRDMLYPQGTEFLHSVRYVGVNLHGDIYIPERMKELRYMVKTNDFDQLSLSSMYGNEQQEKIDGNLPTYNYKKTGSANEFGWKLLGFIEDQQGRLRIQNREETMFCMGCHKTIGTTIDQTFSFPRKVSGVNGWGYINLKGMIDAPNIIGSTDGEILNYLKAVGGGDEFRQNDEMISRWFSTDGEVLEDKINMADVYELITPSPERALKLNKAYWTIVLDQDFNHGRDANITPARNVYESIDENSPVLADKLIKKYDIRLRWEEDEKLLIDDKNGL